MILTLLGTILVPQGCPREAQELPKRGPRAPKRPPELESRIDLIFYLFFVDVSLLFGIKNQSQEQQNMNRRVATTTTANIHETL